MNTEIIAECNQQRAFSGKVWCDDFVDIWLGTCEELRENVAKGNHPRVSAFRASGSCMEYLYYVCWSNDWGANGLLTELTALGTQLYSGHPAWEVYPTGIDRDSPSTRPAQQLIEEQLKEANCRGWQKVSKGPANRGNPKPLRPISGISANAHFIWYDTGHDLTLDAPFSGFNHEEFLIFRLPVRSLFPKACARCPELSCECGCGCDDCHGCNQEADQQNLELSSRAQQKHNTENPVGSVRYPKPFPASCSKRLVSTRTDIDLNFYFHWGDDARDQFEEHDTEVFYLTVCNPYLDARFKGLRITSVKLVPLTASLEEIQIVPDRLICLDCLEPCSCQSREFVLLTRSNTIAGNYRLEVQYCYEEVVLADSGHSSKVLFPLTIIND